MSIVRTFSLPLLLLAVPLAGPAWASGPSTLEAQRALFQATEEALAQGDRDAFEEGLAGLADYPLYGYLLAADLASRLGQASAREVRVFLEHHGHTPHGERLRDAWLTHLADERRWADLARDFTPRRASTTLICRHRQALLALERTDEALADMGRIWLTGESLPAACNPVLDAWREAGGLTPELAWQRLGLALAAGAPSRARYIARYLPEDEQAWAQRWLALYRDPGEVATAGFDATDHPRASEMLTQAWLRLARQDPQATLPLWRRQGMRQQLPEDRVLAVEQALALRLVLRTGAGSLAHLASLPAAVFDETLREWHVRAALAAGDWQTVLAAIEAMAPAQREADGWRYWRARALAALGREDAARGLYIALAGERNFYGFLAADRAGLPYRLGYRPLIASPERVQALAARPALRRAREWLALGRYVEARREWERTLAGLDTEDLKAASVLAHDWGWHDRAIFAAARAGEFDDVELRFPLAHVRLMMEQAARQGINPAWAMAVARQESAFMADARSHAGALGLMQVMPATGRNMARHVNLRLSHAFDLLDPAVNVPIGAYYLRRNLDRFGGHPILSTAAYNAGAHRVSEWLPQTGAMDADVWAELIPYHETRKYVRRVLAYQVIYESRLGLDPTRLSSLLPPVTAASDLEASRVAHNAQWDSETGELSVYTQVCEAPGRDDQPCS